ncbi:VTT domain-containing protein [Streptomyces sp. Tue6028]|uniref:VTT domain-containing protein n=1 Tax=Streptomyces sp. Tue6028 TaxID=2036037 RepID=UPI003D740114
MDQWLRSLPPTLVCVSLALTIALQYVCLPAPGGIAMTTAALLTVDGQVHPAAAVLSAAAGAVAGGAAGHRIGNRAGRTFLRGLAERQRGPLTQKRIDSLEHAAARAGLWVVAAAPFSAALRSTIAPVCGTVGTRRPPFLAVTAVGVTVWAGTTIIAVRVLGEAAGRWINFLAVAGLAVLLVVLGSTGVRAVVRLRHRRAAIRDSS